MVKRPFKRKLTGTTALIGAALLCVPVQTARADVLVDNRTENTTVNLTAGESLVVTDTGIVDTGGNHAVTVTGVTATFVQNDGIIRSNQRGIDINGGAMSGSITNSGSIAIQQTAIYLRNTSALAGGITNSGTITGDYGIAVESNSTVTGEILNSGSINANTTALYFSNAAISAAVSNSGIINANLNLVYANAAQIYSLNNTGTITTGDTAMQLTNNTVVSNGISNSGTIDANGRALEALNGTTIQGGYKNSGVIIGQYALDLHDNATITGGITNSGTVTHSQRAYQIRNNALITGGFINSGTLTASNNENVLLNEDATLTGGFINSGTITGGNTGLGVKRADTTLAGGITNSGLISAGNNGISVNTDATIAGGIINSGTLNGTDRPFYINDGILQGGFTNSGTITGGAQGAILIQSAAQLFNGITNSGSIISNNHGIFFLNNVTATGDINNSGTLIGANHALYLQTNNTLTGDLINSGALTGANNGVQLLDSVITGDISNSGSINGTNGAGIRVADGNSDILGAIINSGTISGATYGLYMDSGASLAGGLTNSGTIIGLGGQAIRFNDPTSVINIILDGGRIIGDVVDIHPNRGNTDVSIVDDFTTEGNFTVSSLAIASGETLTISASDIFSTHDSSVIAGTIAFNVASNVSYGTLVSTAGTFNLTNATIAVDLSGTTGLTDGLEIRIINADSALVGGPGGVATAVLDNSYFWDFEILDGTAATANTGSSDLYLRVIKFDSVDIVISTPTTDSIPMEDDSSLTVTGTGSIVVTNDSAVVLDQDTIRFINNVGTIAGSPTLSAIFLGNSSTISDGITNSGTINGNNGISAWNGSTIASGITNSGSIISINDSQDAAGIYLIGSTLTGGVHNQGLITSNLGKGIALNQSSLQDGLTNSGRITSDDSAAIILSSVSVLSGGLTNSGTISGTNNNALALSTSTLTGNLTNSGTMSGGAGVSLVASQLTGNLINSGIIAGNASAAIALETASLISGFISNSGTILGSDYGILVGNSTSSDIVGGITNSGTISANTGIFAGTSGGITGGITNSGTIEGTGGTAIVWNTSTGLDTSSLAINGGRIIGDVIDSTPAGGSNVTILDGFTTEGNFDVSGLTINGSQTLTISAGDVFSTYNNAVINGILSFDIASTASYGLLVVTNGAADITNATITISAASATLSDGDQIRIINGANALVGGPGATPTVVSDNSFLWDFEIFDGTVADTPTDNTDLFARAIAVATTTDAASNPNNQAAAEALDSANGTNDPTLQAVIANLNNAPTQQAVNNVLESVQPTVDSGIVESISAAAHQSIDLIQSRLSDLRNNRTDRGIATGDLANGLSVWGQAFGQRATQDRRDNIAGYDLSSYGMVFGVDSENILDNAVIGIAGSYGSSTINSKDANNTDTDVNSYQIGLYGDYDITDSVFFSGSLAYGYNNISTLRHDIGAIAGLDASGDYSASQYTAHAELGKDFQIKPAGAPTITPKLQATYTHFAPDDYTETGAGGAGLRVETQSLSALELGFDVEAQWDVKDTQGATWSPSVHAGYRYDVIGDRLQTTSNFIGGGTSFETQGANPARGTAMVGTGIKYQATNKWTFSASYDFDVKEDFSSHAAMLRAGYKF